MNIEFHDPWPHTSYRQQAESKIATGDVKKPLVAVRRLELSLVPPGQPFRCMLATKSRIAEFIEAIAFHGLM